MRGTSLPPQDLAWPIPWDGVVLVAEHEQCWLKAYRCQAKRWTCGWGETEGVDSSTSWSQSEADARFVASLTIRTRQVQMLLQEEATPNELAALVSLQYNIGREALRDSTALKAHNRGDRAAAARAFALWNKVRVDGKLQVSNGLVARRAAEAALYLRPEPDAMPQPPAPRAVAAESSIVASPMAQAGAATVATSAVGVLIDPQADIGSVGKALADLQQLVASSLHIAPDSAMHLALIVAGGVVLYWRLRQRREGWA